ncbi:MAG: Hemin transporter, permease protein [Moraxellaceae bacterium]|jgi:iron complex transport system permease protein|nr:Hemin transporter, permease protein [Moraxellaceae bacterium]
MPLLAVTALVTATALLWDLDSLGAMQADVLWQLRLPRVLLAAFTGATLALAGLLLQDFFRNPLVEPGLLGVSAGAGLAAVLAIASGLGGLWTLPLAAFAGALAALLLVLGIGRRLGAGNAALLLVGVAINALAAALVHLLLSLGDDTLLRSASFWLMGSFAQADWTLLLPALLILLLVVLRTAQRATALDLWQLGDSEAAHLGLDIRRFRREILLLASLLVALAVAQSGGIGFIGLLAPHMARRLGPQRHRDLLPATLALGALLAVAADFLARLLISPLELPVGVLTALLGAPAFLFLFMRSQRP